MSNEEQSRRGFLTQAGLVAGAIVGESVLPEVGRGSG